MTDTATLDARRQAAQLDFIARGAPLVVGDLAATPFDREALAALGPDDAVLRIDTGLSAEVLCLQAGGQRWALKRAWPEARVRNADGRTAFLNEIQRRADHLALKRREPARWHGLADTAWASFGDGLLLSPWIDGGPVAGWDERQLGQLLRLACDLWLEGLFEWDLSEANILDDGRQVWLFDFGYQYRFDPLTQFSSAGHGDDQPLFHPAERFETRCFSAHLLALERTAGRDAALAAFRREKAVALQAYRHLRREAAARGAQAHVLAWLDGFIGRWAAALQGDAADLYLAEAWRSHVLDLDDDLRGQSCTPLTLERADWLLAALAGHFGALRAGQAFFGHDAGLDREALRRRYAALRRQAEAFQLSTRKEHGA
ncbi:hypothetical protein [Roseateles sp.]|uniref:hypothetical protein n=1 Tax=Roseateles sp. TaxID=1971397 RepID=UPI002E04A28A|nr:hypothetical protein [Roseateles sp.]